MRRGFFRSRRCGRRWRIISSSWLRAIRLLPQSGRGGFAMSAIPGIVAINTFREAVRDRVLYNLIVFALMMMGASVLVGEISIGISRLVIINLGLSAISIFGLVMAIFIGVGLVYKEMEKRTLYSLLAKPVRRWEFLVGKFGGLVLTLTVNTLLHDVGPGRSALLRKPRIPPRRRDDSNGHLFHRTGAGAGDRAGSLFLMLFKPHAFHAVHAGNLCGRVFLQRYSRDRHGHAKPRDADGRSRHQLFAAELSQF